MSLHFSNDFFKEYLNKNYLECKNVGSCNLVLYSENNLNIEFIEKVINKTSK